jgi:ankyrin repeat protein
MSRELPAQPSLEHLRKQAKALLRDAGTGTSWQLSDAQHEIAKQYGFATWAKLKEHVEALALAANPGLALDRAIRAHDAEEMRRLLRSSETLRATINEPMAEGSFGITALISTVQRTNRAMVDVLLEYGADINQKSHWWAGGFGVLDETSIEFAPYLIERGARVDPPAAARLGMIDELRAMIADDANAVHARGGDGQMALHNASTMEIAQLLLDNGADIDALDVDHESTAAQYMLRVTQTRHFPRDRQDIARELVARGTRTDILMATALGDMALVRTHLEADPESIRTRVSDHYFPMHNPRAGGTIYIWVLGKHRTAHTVARDFGHEDIYRYLMDRTPHDMRLAIAGEVGDEVAFSEVLARQPDLVATLSTEEQGKLADAAENNNLPAVRLMLSAGWPVDAYGAYGATALHWAAFHGNTAMVKEILQYKPSVDINESAHGGTPLGWAGYGSEHGWHRDTGDYAGAADALIRAGATVPRDMDEYTATQAVRDVIDRLTKPAPVDSL